MKISVSINGVLRNVLERFQVVYEKYYQEVKSDVVCNDLLKYVHFETSEDLSSFLYEEAPMEIFGQATEKEHNVIQHLVELYKSMPLDYKLRVVSDDFGKSRPSTLWFLAKYGCCCDEIKFYEIQEIEDLWQDTDLFITDDLNIINAKPKNKKLIVIGEDKNTGNIDLIKTSLKDIESFEEILLENEKIN
mgnify:FL=1|tara:strand:+ start:100 stop:669 length:570 start_codon:yes stop_codon:yes gene_type:complete